MIKSIKKYLASVLINSKLYDYTISNIKNNKYVLSLAFHNPSKKVFNDCIQWLHSNNFKIISLDDLFAIKNNDKELNSNYVIITFDDGWRDNIFNVIPITELYKIPITIFITTEPVVNGDAFWWSYVIHLKNKHFQNYSVPFLKKIINSKRVDIINEIKGTNPLNREAFTVDELFLISRSKYITIGAHSVSHPILTNCSDIEVNYEIYTSKKVIENITQKVVLSFAYPNGNYTNREINALHKFGYKIAFTTQKKYLEISAEQNFYTLPRFDILDDTSLEENICRMTGLWFNKLVILKSYLKNVF